MRPIAHDDPVVFATKTALRTLGRRVLALDQEKNALDGLLGDLVQEVAPGLLELYKSESTPPPPWSPPATTPIGCAARRPGPTCAGCRPSSSSQVTRLRLNRRGDRGANSALWGVGPPPACDPIPHPRTHGPAPSLQAPRSKPEIIRALKRVGCRPQAHKHLPR